MRDLSLKEQRNEILFHDVLSNSKIKFFYRMPTTAERIQYKSALVNTLAKSKRPEDLLKVQLEWAKKFITGFREGDFAVDGKSISSDEGSENYYPGWKGLIEESAGDLLMEFAERVFDRPSYVIKDDENFFSNGNSNGTNEPGQKN